MAGLAEEMPGIVPPRPVGWSQHILRDASSSTASSPTSLVPHLIDELDTASTPQKVLNIMETQLENFREQVLTMDAIMKEKVGCAQMAAHLFQDQFTLLTIELETRRSQRESIATG